MIQKLIVTNVAALKKKYGAAGLKLIQKALARLVAADALRGLTTRIEAVDNPTRSAPKVTIIGNQRQVKATIDKLFTAHGSPDYLLILGGPDVIPHQLLENPLFSPPDDIDRNVPSDLPYACSAPFSTKIPDFIGPTRVVGRLPDVVGSRKVADLVALIDGATTFSGTPGKTSLVLSADEWAGASRANVRLAFGALPRRAIEMVPPKSPPWSSAQLAHPLHFINCHGDVKTPMFFGSSTANYPTALEASGVVGKVTRGSVITAECCYGAQLYKPTKAKPLSIPETYLSQGAAGFCGSSNIAYGSDSASGRCAADILCVEFVKAVLAKASLGRALLEARIKFIKSTGSVADPADEKTLGQFMLLGDPSTRPFGAGLEAPEPRSVTRGFAKALAAVAPMAPADHRAGRKALEQAGDEIARTKPFAERVKGAAKSTRGPIPGGKTLIFRVVRPAAAAQPKAKTRGARAARSSADQPTEQIQVTFITSADAPRARSALRGGAKAAAPRGNQRRIPYTKAVITRTRGAEVLSSRRIVSK
ncbi:MAG: hypothetical protein K0Q92_3552 [Steroidobacteraceae bacterium]|nr:hypothetical protein [Steroidobacteraceae bacterium]